MALWCEPGGDNKSGKKCSIFERFGQKGDGKAAR